MASPSLRQTIGTIAPGGGSVAPPSNTLAGNAIVVRVAAGVNATPTQPVVSDSVGNVYTVVGLNYDYTYSMVLYVLIAFNAAAISTAQAISVSLPGMFVYGTATVIEEWNDLTGVEGTALSARLTTSAGPIVTVVAIDTMYAAVATNTSFGAGAGYTALGTAVQTPFNCCGEYEAVGSTGSYSATWSGAAWGILAALSSGAPRTPGTPTLSTTSTPLSITVRWTPSAGLSASSQRVQRSLNGSVWATISTVGIGVGTYIDTSIATNTLYYYRIESVNAAGTTDGASANITSATAVMALTLSPSEVPLQIVMSWVALASATGYVPQRSPDGSTWADLTVSQTATTYTDTGISPGIAYYYRVKGTSGAGTFFSPIMPLYAPGPVAPVAPTLALEPYGLGGPIVAVLWTPSQGLVTPSLTYAVDRSPDNTTWTPVATGIVGCNWSDEAVPSAGTWYYRLRTLDSLYSSTGPSHSILVPILAPKGLTVTQIAATTHLALAWSTVPTVVSWTVERSTDGVAYSALVTGQAAATLTYEDDTGSQYHRYWYRVTAVNASGSATGKAASIIIRPSVDLAAGPTIVEGGTDISAPVDPTSLSVPTQVGNQGDTANFAWQKENALGEIYRDVAIFDGDTLYFSGHIFDVQQGSQSVGFPVATITAQGPFSLFSAIFPDESFEQQSAGYIIASLIARSVPGLTFNNVQAGPAIPAVVFTGQDLMSCIRQCIGDIFSPAATVNFYLDSNWDVHLEFGSALPISPIALTDANPVTGAYP